MIVFKAGRILERGEWMKCVCPLSMSGEGVVRCTGPRCPKWVTLMDVLFLLPPSQQKPLNDVYKTDDDQLSCGFCSL